MAARVWEPLSPTHAPSIIAPSISKASIAPLPTRAPASLQVVTDVLKPSSASPYTVVAATANMANQGEPSASACDLKGKKDYLTAVLEGKKSPKHNIDEADNSVVALLLKA